MNLQDQIDQLTRDAAADLTQMKESVEGVESLVPTLPAMKTSHLVASFMMLNDQLVSMAQDLAGADMNNPDDEEKQIYALVTRLGKANEAFAAELDLRIPTREES